MNKYDMVESEFREMCRSHDLFFKYSDDQKVWQNGMNSRHRIAEFSKKLTASIAAKIWNEVVDEKTTDLEARSEYYWNYL